MILLLWKEIFHSDGQQFHDMEQNEQSPLTSTQFYAWIEKTNVINYWMLNTNLHMILNGFFLQIGWIYNTLNSMDSTHGLFGTVPVAEVSHGCEVSELQISCVFAFFTLWKRIKTHVLSDQSVHLRIHIAV